MTTGPLVVFDLGGVLCRFEPTARLAALASATGLPADRIDAAIWGSGLDDRASAGELSPDETVVEVLAALDQRLSADVLRAAWAAAFVPDDEVVAIARTVAGPTAVFTDNGPLVDACLDGVRDAVDVVVATWQLGARKPDPIAYQRLAARLGRHPVELLIIDDSEANCVGARAAGCSVIRYQGPGALRALLFTVPHCRR